MSELEDQAKRVVWERVAILPAPLLVMRAAYVRQRNAYRASKRRLLRAGNDYVDAAGHRAPQWLGTIHHRIIRHMVYAEGHAQGCISLIDQIRRGRT